MDQTGIEDEILIVDWLSFTFAYAHGLENVEFIFGERKQRKRGIRGYALSADLPCGGVVGWSPDRPTQGVHVELSSSALAKAVELRPSMADIRGVLRFILDLGGKITRIDFAFDDRDGRLSMETITQHAQKEHLVTRWRSGDNMQGFLDKTGQTLNFGSRASDSFLRIYDKQAERIDKGKPDPDHWIRVELELKRDKAHRAVAFYLDKGPAYAAGLLRGLIEFKEPTESSNKSIWPTCAWWESFLQAVEKQKLSTPRDVPTLERCYYWLLNQAAPSMALLTMAGGGDVDWFYHMVHEGAKRLSPAQQALLDSVGLCEVSYDAE